MSTTKPQGAQQCHIKNRFKTAEEAVAEMGGSVSPLVREALHSLYLGEDELLPKAKKQKVDHHSTNITVSTTRPRRTPRPLIEKVSRKTADDAVAEMGGSVSPLVREALDALYGTEAYKELDDHIDFLNRRIEASNRQWRQLDDQSERLAKLEEASNRQWRQLKQIRVDLEREMSLYRFFDSLEGYDS